MLLLTDFSFVPRRIIRYICALVSVKEHEKNKLLQIKRRFSRIDLFLKKECAGGT